MAKLGQCQICTECEAKYKCPRCVITYCSLKCFKDERHTHDLTVQEAPVEEEVQEEEDQQPTDAYEALFQDDRLRYLLKFQALQVHLRSVYRLLSDQRLTHDKKIDMANDELTSLRIAGSQANELVEEFCQLVMDVLNGQS